MKLTNDLADWFPVLAATGVAVPKTEIIRTDAHLVAAICGENPIGIYNFQADLRLAAERIGYPVFLRSGHTSAKHSWIKSCYVSDSSQLLSHALEIVEYGEMSSLVGPPCDTWAVREFLRTKAAFTAFQQMPVTKERRYFIENGEVTCHHPYWPTEAFEDGGYADEANWPQLLSEINLETDEEIQYLSDQSRIVSRSFPGAWSLDWLFTDMGWFAIDMALAEDSYHWPDCPKAA